MTSRKAYLGTVASGAPRAGDTTSRTFLPNHSSFAMPTLNHGSRGSNSSLEKNTDIERIDEVENISGLSGSVKHVLAPDDVALKDADLVTEAANGMSNPLMLWFLTTADGNV